KRIAIRTVGLCRVKHPLPWISGFADSRGSIVIRHVRSDCVCLEAVDTTFSLFDVDRIGRMIPMDNCMTVGVEIESFLAHRCARKDEWPERRVEPRPDCGLSIRGLVTRGSTPEPGCDVRPELVHSGLSSSSREIEVVDRVLRRAQ